ncbi:hypothetical protein B0H12DRAFT_1107893 [Mycena haematopus]|nr:hypothetical protein B0H12DRAFT_1107893 [Mycena haematopus]
MADVEFQVPPPTHEPTFIKPLDTASRRRSRASQNSAAASTRSWVLMNQQSPPPPAEPIPVPEPIPALAPTPGSRPLPEPPRRTSAIVVDEEHMSVELPPMGYQWQTARGAKAREAHTHKGFVGGFVSGLRRLPRALVRTRRRRGTMHTEEETEGTEQTGMTGNTLPRYVSNPTTPVVPDATVSFARNADAGRRPRHPSFRLVPPEEDLQQDVGDAQEEHGDGDATMLDLPQSPLENPYDREATSIHGTPLTAPSPHASRAGDHLVVPSAELDLDEPASVQAHPLPTEDYRRMSAADAAQQQSPTTISSGSFSADSPSFSAELHGVRRFWNALHVLPWVAPERLTADYEPKLRSKPSASWYHPKGESDAVRALNVAVSPASPVSPTSGTRSPPRHRTHHRRATTPPDPRASPPPTTPGFPFQYPYYPAFSPPPPPPSPPPTQTQTQTQRSRRAPSPPPRRTHTHAPHRHRRRSATYHSHSQPMPLSMPPPWVPPPLLPAPPAPVYIIQASPAATPSPPPPPPAPPSSSAQATSGSAQGTPGSGSGSPPPHPSPRSDGSGSGKAHAQMLGLGLAPVYMQMQLVPLPVSSPIPGSQQQQQQHQLAFVAGDARYPYGYSYPYGYGVGAAAYSSGGSAGSGYGSPIAMPVPAQTVGG